MNRWQKIFDALCAAGIETYPPGSHLGPCTAPYCVVQTGSASISGGAHRQGKCEYKIYLVVPIEQPAELERLSRRVKDALAPMVEACAIRMTAPGSPMMPDDTFSALVSCIDYICCYSERN